MGLPSFRGCQCVTGKMAGKIRVDYGWSNVSQGLSINYPGCQRKSCSPSEGEIISIRGPEGLVLAKIQENEEQRNFYVTRCKKNVHSTTKSFQQKGVLESY